MGALMRSMRWDATVLGPPQRWPESLRSTLGLCLDAAFPIAIYWGPQLALLYNDAWQPILGEKHPWALGRPARDVWPEIWQEIGPVFERVERTKAGVFKGDSLLAMHRHGYLEECYFDYTFNPIRHGDDEVAGIFNVVIETTYRVINERRGKMQRELAARLSGAREAETALDLVMECLSEADLDVPFALLYRAGDEASPARLLRAVRVTGERARDPRAWPISETAREGRARVVRDLLPRLGALSGGAWPEPPREALVLPIAVPGDAHPELVLVAGASARRELDHHYVSFFESIGRHVTSALASARAFDAERRRAESLAELDRAKTTFFSDVSHELRTPLTLVLGPLSDLLARLEPETGEEVRQLLLLAQRNGQRLIKLVNTLLEFTRIEAGGAQALYEETDLTQLTAELAANFHSACEPAGLELSVSCEPLDMPAFVDRDMWERIVLNLISNAFKFTLEGGITVTLRQREDRAVLTVKDTGVGIPEPDLPKIFDRFHRVESVQGRSQEGTGIGLALVHELVRLHAGEIHAESVVGEGSFFYVVIPLGDAHLPPDRVSRERTSVQVKRATPFVEEVLSWLGGETMDAELIETSDEPLETPTRVLVADDNADMRGYIARLLAGAHEVVTVADGRDALVAARRVPPDLIVSDAMMPGLDGFGLLRALRADDRTRDIPFLMLSARAGEEARVEGLQAGVDDYLVKPFSGRELLARVSGAIRLVAQRREADRRKDEFLATLAHELRNPLAPIQMAVDVLKRAREGEDLDGALAIIERQVTSMTRLIDDLMDVSRISRGKVELRKERLELRPILDDAVEATRSLIEAAEQSLSVTVPSKPIWVHGDRLRLAQVFINLLTNASKYSGSGASIELVARQEEDEVSVRVRDDGMGIAPEMLESIWDMFVQANRSLDSGHSGLGIGLTLVRSLVEMHDGSAQVESAGPNRGSTFTVRLPMIAAPEPEADDSGARAAVATPRLSSRVLIADDNRDAADTLHTFLKIAGCEVATAYDGKTALELGARTLPQVALLDLGMPGLGGLELARRIRREPWGRDVVLVAVTGWGQERDRERSAEAGFDHHLVKPVSARVVARLIADVQEAVAEDGG